MLAVSCSCLSYAVCDLYDWTAGVEHESSVLHTVRQYTEENAPEAAASLKEMNTDYVCWLEMEDHSVSLPVVQGDDDAYYLNHAFDNSESGQGTPFFSHDACMDDRIKIIYGHHVYYDSSAMFSPLLQLEHHMTDDNDTFTLQYKTHQDGYQIAYVFPMKKEESTFSLRKHDFADQADFENWISYAAERSIHADSDCTAADEYVLLQTCGRNKDEFLIVIGRKTKKVICS